MSLLQVFRRKIFWFLDVLNGNDIKKHYEDIKELIENSDASSAKIKKGTRLQLLLKHAVSTTWFYQKYSGFSSILDFPIINKNSIRDHFDEFTSSKYNAKNCIVVSTSGSTGAPFSILQNTSKRCRNTADNLYFSKRSGYEIGQELIYIKIWPDTYKHTLLSKYWWKNIYPQNVFKLQDHHIANLIKKLQKDNNPKSFLGYTSALEKICKYLDKTNSGPIQCNVVSIITMSEGLNDYVRTSLKKYFGVFPVSRYSNNENGILAQEDKDISSAFRINSASYFIEVLKLDSDIPADDNERGRIVVTDLYNYAMPIIRYDTGDVGVMAKDEKGVPFLKQIEGRVLDLVYDTKGNLIPSHVSYKLCKYGDYKQFQLVQYGEKDYVIKLNTDTKVDEIEMLEEYKGYFGQDANIHIEYVDEIPLLASGKRREVRNTFHSQL